jgi:di/tricarboxylate transporter
MTQLVATGAAMLTWNYLQRLARRMPHKKMTRLCGAMMFTPLISLFYSFIRNSDWLPDLIPLIYLPASAGVFVWMSILLRRAAREADRHWGMERAGTR